jgi:predicted Fe-Mo cluster-binding NifX family protein
MKVALTVWEDRISPVADSARQVLVAEIVKGSICSREFEHFSNESLFFRAKRFVDLNIKAFICGAISDFYAGLVEGYGILLVPHVRGQVEDVLDAYMKKAFFNPKFETTGCLDANFEMPEDKDRA